MRHAQCVIDDKITCDLIAVDAVLHQVERGNMVSFHTQRTPCLSHMWAEVHQVMASHADCLCVNRIQQ